MWLTGRRMLMQPMRLDTWWQPTSKEYYAPNEAQNASAPGFPAGWRSALAFLSEAPFQQLSPRCLSERDALLLARWLLFMP